VFYISSLYQQKRDYFQQLMANTRFKALPSSGTYFQLYDYSEISDESDVDFAIRLTKEFGVASIPISVFYSVPKQDKVLRFCFAKSEETLVEGARRLALV
jgi:methionine aminotransferase